MKKSELLNIVSNTVGVQKSTCELVINTMVDTITQALVQGEKVSIQDFMTLEITDRNARKARNPATGEIVMFPPVKIIKCKLSKSIRDAVNSK